jgi:hypothetical protein
VEFGVLGEARVLFGVGLDCRGLGADLLGELVCQL